MLERFMERMKSIATLCDDVHKTYTILKTEQSAEQSEPALWMVVTPAIYRRAIERNERDPVIDPHLCHLLGGYLGFRFPLLKDHFLTENVLETMSFYAKEIDEETKRLAAAEQQKEAT